MIARQRQGAVDIFRLNDVLTEKQIENVRHECLSNLPTGQPRLVVDLNELNLLDSAGLELLLELQEVCLRRGGLLKLSAASPLCADILNVTGVLEQIELYPTEVDAVGSFAL